jgi:hypothetical protein
MPSIDERLEAIAMHLESASATLEETRRIVNLLAEAQVKSEHKLDKAEEIVNKLVVIAHSHDGRIARLEG